MTDKHDAETSLRALERVRDEASFLEFLAAFAKDWDAHTEVERSQPSAPYAAGAYGWENATVGAFLESAHAGGQATMATKEEANPWRRAAEILYLGKIYE